MLARLLNLAAALLLAAASAHVDANASPIKTAHRVLETAAVTASGEIARVTLDGIREKWLVAEECASGVSSYLYANANPVSYTDPSGYMSLQEVNTVQSIQGGARGAAPTVSKGAINIARNAKIYDVFTYVEPWPPHFYMYVERIGTMAGTRYDVGARGGWGDILSEICHGNFCGAMPGGYVAAEPATRASLKGKGKRIASFTLGQAMLWHVPTVGTETETCALDYSLIPGPNCLSWTIVASAKAIAISRTKL